MLTHLGLAASAAIAVIVTNLDNLAVMLALLVSAGRVQVVVGFASAQAIVLAVAMAVAYGADQTMPAWTGYLGVVPLGLGVVGVWRQWQGSTNESAAMSAGGTLLASTALFLTLSTDSLAAVAPLIADSLPAYRISALLGSAVAALAVAALALVLARQTSPQSRWVTKLERLGPYAMIVVGLYVLANSGTDAI